MLSLSPSVSVNHLVMVALALVLAVAASLGIAVASLAAKVRQQGEAHDVLRRFLFNGDRDAEHRPLGLLDRVRSLESDVPGAQAEIDRIEARIDEGEATRRQEREDVWTAIARLAPHAELAALRGRLDAQAATLQAQAEALRAVVKAGHAYHADQAVAISRARTELEAQLRRLDGREGDEVLRELMKPSLAKWPGPRAVPIGMAAGAKA